MAQDRLSGKFAVILHADVAGSTQLVQQDELLAHELIQGAFRRFKDCIEKYMGSVLELRGDALLAQFERPSDAVIAALAYQADQAYHKSQLKGDLRPTIRVGIAMGEVVIADRTVTGAGVVLAQRIEQLAQPGGVCIHGAVYETLPRRLPFDYSSLGDQQLKGFEEPIRVYSVNPRLGVPLPEPERIALSRTPKRTAKPQWIKALGAPVAIVFAGLFAVWVFLDAGPNSFTSPPSLVSRPSIAVLPFHNLSASQEQEYFSDGITGDIINDLSKFSNLTVISRNSVFTYKGAPISAQIVGEQLGVEYVLEGSVQRANEQIRINTQLVDTGSQRQLWAARYDEPISNLFDVQDKIAQEIVRALSVRVSDIERRRVFAQSEPKFPAYDVTLQARALVSTLTRQDNFEARKLFRRSIDLDSSYSPAYAGLGRTHLNAVLFGWTDVPGRELQDAEELARRAIALDETCVDAHRLLAGVHLQRRQHHLAILEFERAISLNPNDLDSHARQGIAFAYAGRIEAAIRSLELALRIDPNRSADAQRHLGMAYYLHDQYEDALIWLERASARNPENVFTRIVLAATYAQLNNREQAQRQADAVRRLDPFFSSEQFGRLYVESQHRSHIVDGVRKAGLN